MSALEEYNEMTRVKHDASYLANHTTHHADCGCLTKAADAMRDELLATLAERDKMLRLACQDRKRIWEREMRHNGLWDQYEHPLDGESIDYWLADLARRVEGGE